MVGQLLVVERVATDCLLEQAASSWFSGRKWPSANER
jgi:hypothetical protein